MFSATELVIALLTISKIYAEEDIYYTNGWRPLSKEKVFENLYITDNKRTDGVDSKASWNPILFAKENIGRLQESVDVKAHDINRELMSKYDDNFEIDEKQNQVNISDRGGNYNPRYVFGDENKIIRTLVATNGRTAKNIFGNNDNVAMSTVRGDNNKKDVIESIEEDVKTEETNVINSKSNSYEVIEATEAFEISDLLSINRSEPAISTYIKPKFVTEPEKNLSNILFSILRNYNIRINDDSSNYAISRTKHNSNTYKQSYIYPPPLKIPLKQNSQNYFPINRFLAVFLSNYGYYLPGFYGFPGNYYNIYGYLASNNIHNNKPFGAYKIYSDTDSSQ